MKIIVATHKPSRILCSPSEQQHSRGYREGNDDFQGSAGDEEGFGRGTITGVCLGGDHRGTIDVDPWGSAGRGASPVETIATVGGRAGDGQGDVPGGGHSKGMIVVDRDRFEISRIVLGPAMTPHRGSVWGSRTAAD